MKKRTLKIIAAALCAAAVLALAFWYGGRAPGSRGLQGAASTPAVTASAPTISAAPTASPAETAAPVAAPDAPANQTKKSCTVSISCAALLNNMDWLDEDKRELVPPDGVILPRTETALNDGESVFDVLKRLCRDKGIQMEASMTPVYDSAYIEGINNLYEFDAGESSGWMYSVNGAFPAVGCSKYPLKNGDSVCWVYTCDMGRDVGAKG